MKLIPALLGTAGAAAWLALDTSPLAARAGLALLLVVSAWLVRPVGNAGALKLVRGDDDVSPTSAPVFIFYIFVPVILIPGLGVSLTHRAQWWLPHVFAGVEILGGLVAYVAGLGAWKTISELLATPWAGGAVGDAVTVRGTVGHITGPVKRDNEELALSLDETDRYRETGLSTSTRSVDRTEHFTFAGAQAFVITTPTGDITVYPSKTDLAWWSDHQRDLGSTGPRNDSTSRKVISVPAGAEVVARGHLDGRQLKPLATGPVILIGASAGTDPRTRLRSLLTYWRLTALGLVMLAAALAASIAKTLAH